MTDKNKGIDEFVKFTCSTEAEARRYLESSNYNIEAALTAYYDDRDDRDDPSTLGVGPSAENISDRESENESMHADDDDFVNIEPPRPFGNTPNSEKMSSKSEAPKPYKRTTNIATLSSLRSNRDTEDEDDDQLYYAGGSEHSGQQIMGNDRRSDVAGEVFKHLKQMVAVGDVELAGPSKDKKSHFSGVGYRLGQTPEDTQVVNTASRSAGREERAELHLRLWRDGFSIGDEPLRPYSDPENREAIESILRGEVPLELVPPGTTGGKVNVKVEDMRHSNYSGSSSKGKFFTGQGHVLGNVVPTVVKDESPKSQEPVDKSDVTVAPPQSPITVDDKAPVTNIAVRLPTGSRSQVRLNLTHTVEDLRAHITSVHSELGGQPFVFIVGFPPSEVTDEKLSVSAAGLVNSSVHLRIKKV